ncbi:ABC transporter permease [Mameliella sediminis]|uniref:ABC transporter permease n=1 Tax=Mameliella sediminis TaxID=2836866 RepID=UPI001FEAA753|nr:ABC transporter permease [Mameliella sediminis]
MIVLLVLIAFFTVLEPRFFSVRNLARIAISSSPALMVAIGVTFIIIMGSIDLSMEGTVSVSAVVFAFAFIGLGGTVLGLGILALPLAILVGAAIGLINGLVHVKLKIPSFMASLAMGFVGTGFALLLTGGDRIRVEDEVFRGLLTERWFGFPVMVYVAGLFVLIAWFIQARTTLGRNFYAVGGGEELAHASGLNVNKVRVLGFMLAGMFYAVGALLAVGRIGIAETATGNNFMFMSITSVVVGGTALWGGIGGVWNTLVGVLIVNVIGNGMVVIGLPGYVQDGVLGALVIAAVVLSTDRKSIAFVK